MQISANRNVLSVRELIFMFSETLFNFMFTGLRSFGNLPFEKLYNSNSNAITYLRVPQTARGRVKNV